MKAWSFLASVVAVLCLGATSAQAVDIKTQTIANNAAAQKICPHACTQQGMTFSGQWTNGPGGSVCGCNPGAKPPAAPADALGHVWHVSENGWSGVWTRRGQSMVFDAVWTKAGRQVRAEMTMTVMSGNKVSIHRRDTSDALVFTYTGTLSGKRASGVGHIEGQQGRTWNWSATIQ